MTRKKGRLSPAQLKQRSTNGRITWRRTVNRFLDLHHPDLDRTAQAVTGWMRVTLPIKTRGMTRAYLERWIEDGKWIPTIRN